MSDAQLLNHFLFRSAINPQHSYVFKISYIGKKKVLGVHPRMKTYRKDEETAQHDKAERQGQEHRRQRMSTLLLLSTLETLGNHSNALQFP